MIKYWARKVWTVGIFFLILCASATDVSLRQETELHSGIVKSFIKRETSKFEKFASPLNSEDSTKRRLRRFLSPMGRIMSQPWLPTLIAQEEEDRNRRADVQKKREKDEWHERLERRERDLAAERQERANVVEREWRGWRGERHMQFERQERAERQDRGTRDQIMAQQWRGVYGSRQLREEEQEQSDTEERMERNERATREERDKRVSMVDRYLRDHRDFGREQRAFYKRERFVPYSHTPEYYGKTITSDYSQPGIKNFEGLHFNGVEEKLGSKGYHIAEPEVAVGDALPTEESEEEIDMENIDSEEEHWHILKLY